MFRITLQVFSIASHGADDDDGELLSLKLFGGSHLTSSGSSSSLLERTHLDLLSLLRNECTSQLFDLLLISRDDPCFLSASMSPLELTYILWSQQLVLIEQAAHHADNCLNHVNDYVSRSTSRRSRSC